MNLKEENIEVKNLEEINAFKEFISSEKSFGTSMLVLKKALENGEITPKSELMSTIYAIAKELAALSKKIIIHLDDTSDEVIQELRDLREERKEIVKQFFDIYKRYVTIYKQFIEEQKKDKTQFVSLNKHLTSNNNGQTLPSLLIMPIQRGMRYTLLITELLKDKSLDQNKITYLNKFSDELKDKLEQVNNELAELERGYRLGDYTLKGISSTYSYFKSYFVSDEKPKEKVNNVDDAYYLGKISLGFGSYLYNRIAGNEEKDSKEEIEELLNKDNGDKIDTKNEFF
jgi:hypothetical protein